MQREAREALVAIDMAILSGLIDAAALGRYAEQSKGRPGAARFVGRADLFYRAARLVLEYDGGNHRERMVDDNRRQNLLVNAGYRVLRFTSADIHSRPDVVIAQVREALASKAPMVPNVSNRRI